MKKFSAPKSKVEEKCTKCGKPAVQIVVHEGKVILRRCEEHKLGDSPKVKGFLRDGLVEGDDGTKQWHLNGRLHRVDGPAIEHPDGSIGWFQNGLAHRTDGPALEYPDNIGYPGDLKQYWYKGKRISEEEFFSSEFQIRITMDE